MKLTKFLVISFILLMISACGNSSSSDFTDLCNDQAWDECAHIARDQCGLSSTSSDRELQSCRPYAECEAASFDACMDEHD